MSRRVIAAGILVLGAASATVCAQQAPADLFVINEAMDQPYAGFSTAQDEYYSAAPGMTARLYFRGRSALEAAAHSRRGYPITGVETALTNPSGCTTEFGGKRIEITDASGGVTEGCIAAITPWYIRFMVPRDAVPRYGSVLKQLAKASVLVRDTATGAALASGDVPIVGAVPGLYLADPEGASVGALPAPVALITIVRDTTMMMGVSSREPIDMSLGLVSAKLMATGVRNFNRSGQIRVRARGLTNGGMQMLETSLAPDSVMGVPYSVGADEVNVNLSHPNITDLARQADGGEIRLSLVVTDQSVPITESNPVSLRLANLVPSRVTEGSRGPGGRRGDGGGRTVAP